MNKWHLEKRKIKDLQKNPNNPRIMKDEQAQRLKTSIQKFGLCEPIVINPDGFIIGGHQRVETLKGLGEKEVDVYVPDEALTNQEIQELTIRLNKNTGEWDFDILSNAYDFDVLAEVGFTAEDLHMDEIEDEKPSKKKEKLCPNCGYDLNKK